MTKLKSKIEANGIKLGKISEACQIEYYRLYRIVNGMSEPRVPEAMRLAEYFECTLDEIIEAPEAVV
jgi:transcriptional regulator with XRE-family HTH domain